MMEQADERPKARRAHSTKDDIKDAAEVALSPIKDELSKSPKVVAVKRMIVT